MTRVAWLYIYMIFAAAAALAVTVTLSSTPNEIHWASFGVLLLLSIISQIYKAVAPPNDNQSYSAGMTFLFAGVVLLDPPLFVLLVCLAHLFEWALDLLRRTGNLPVWYIQPFNIATHILAGLAAQWIFFSLNNGSAGLLSLNAVEGFALAALTYTLINHYLIGQALVLARKVTWRQSGVLQVENLLTDFCLLCIGYVCAILWSLNEWLVIPALAPLFLLHRALQIPKLKAQAALDSKTGLLNAAHFNQLFAQELERARRFGRPLTLIMADLDLLRNVNNLYGHLAGDTVLIGIAQLIRDNIREYDIAGRFGGEEFIIALPETEVGEARMLAERLRQAVAATLFSIKTNPTPIRVTLSLGLAGLPDDGATAVQLIHQADLAVYQAKLKGRNQVVSSAELPHAATLESMNGAARGREAVLSEFIPRPEVAGSEGHPAAAETAAAHTRAATTAQAVPATAMPQPAQTGKREWLLHAFVLAVVLGAGALIAKELELGATPNGLLIVALVALAAIAEIFQVDLYEKSTVSVSVAINFAAALIAGIVGVALVSTTIAVSSATVSVLKTQKRPNPEKILFNTATHILAASVPLLFFNLNAFPLHLEDMLLLSLPLIISGMAYYLLDTGLVACAIGLETQTDIRMQWQERFRWLANHYLLLAAIGVFLAIAYVGLGIAGLFVFAVPALMMRFAQAQYVERTRNSVHQVQYINEQLARANSEITQASQEIQALNEDLFQTLANLVDARDPYMSGHSLQVAEYATAVAREMGLPAERIKLIRQAGFLHDIGKMAISEQVLQKPTQLTHEEYEYIKSHAQLGGALLENSKSLRHLAPFVRHHHEYWDGHGYPGGLRGTAISLEARILSVCDAVEAMASDRPYHQALPIDEIIVELHRCMGAQFDPAIVQTFVRIMKREGARWVVNSATAVAANKSRYGYRDMSSTGWAPAGL